MVAGEIGAWARYERFRTTLVRRTGQRLEWLPARGRPPASAKLSTGLIAQGVAGAKEAEAPLLKRDQANCKLAREAIALLISANNWF